MNFVKQAKESDIEKMVQQYDIQDVIGDGAFGRVFKCTERSTQQKFAFKKIVKRLLSTEEVSKQFVNDVELIKQLDHPNILKVHEVYQDQFYFYVVEEFCEGQVLIDYITKHKKSMTEREIGTIIRQVLYTLAYAHSKKIAHRDIKPENIMIYTYKNKDNE